jgi:hypothetical protein
MYRIQKKNIPIYYIFYITVIYRFQILVRQYSNMERWYKNDSDFQRLYNCSFYQISEVPLERRQTLSLGIFYITASIVQIVSFFSVTLYTYVTSYFSHL